MSAPETLSTLAAFDRRGAGSNSERRAADALAHELDGPDREVSTEPFWCRPNWALAHAWHALLGVAGSLLAVHSQILGGALVLIALVSVIADALSGYSLGRRLSPERASQNVIVATGSDTATATVIITANYDAGRTGLAYRGPLRSARTRLAHATGHRLPGWLGWIAIALAWLGAVAIARLAGSGGAVIGIVQLIPTVALVLTFALLLDIASADFGPAAGDNGTGVAVAVALHRALAAAPPRHATINLVLTGAGDGGGIGLRRYLKKHAPDARTTAVLGIAPCADGTPRWWTSDGPLVALRYSATLRDLCERIAAGDPGLEAAPHRGRGTTPALPARIARVPAITIGCLTADGPPPRSHQPTDLPDAVDSGAADRAVEFGLLLIDAIDAHFGQAITTSSKSSVP